jgi:hypothetical protein
MGLVREAHSTRPAIHGGFAKGLEVIMYLATTKKTKTLFCNVDYCILYFQYLLYEVFMDIGQAFSMFHVDAILSAKVIEKPALSRSVWVVQFEMRKEPPLYITTSLETARGEEKIFKSVEAALKDLKNIGFTDVVISMSTVENFRRNRFEWLYEWIVGLHEQGWDEERILQAFETCPATHIDLSNEKEVSLAKAIIGHAVGRTDGKELEAYLPPIDVLDIKWLKTVTEGYLFQAICPDSAENFYFLIESSLSEKQLSRLVSTHKDVLCKRVLVAAHTQHPYQVSDSEIQIAACRLTHTSLDDIVS